MLLDGISIACLALSPKAAPVDGFRSLRQSLGSLSSSFDFSKKPVKKSKRGLNLAGGATL